jgi:hypothetical protein
MSDQLTVRDTFAAAALNGWLASQQTVINQYTMARKAYEYADAMLRERAKTAPAEPPTLPPESDWPPHIRPRTNHDAAPAARGDDRECAAPVTTGGTQEPVAWAVDWGDGYIDAEWVYSERAKAECVSHSSADAKVVPLFRHPHSQLTDAESLARLWHDEYERRAAEFGYETRPDTRQFNQLSPNGLLMIETCRTVLERIFPQPGLTEAERDAVKWAAQLAKYSLGQADRYDALCVLLERTT